MTIFLEKTKLTSIILKDLLKHEKIQLILLICILTTSFFVVFITHKTRCLISIKEKTLVEKKFLETQWRNLLIEENVLGENIRVERIAKKSLCMKFIDTSNENIIVFY